MKILLEIDDNLNRKLRGAAFNLEISRKKLCEAALAMVMQDERAYQYIGAHLGLKSDKQKLIEELQNAK